MLHAESQMFFDRQVLGRYPDFDPSSMQMGDWVSALQKFPRDNALQALRQFYATPSGGYKKPKLGAIIDICRSESQRTGGEAKDKKTPEPLFILKCIEHPTWRTDTEVPFYPRDPKCIPQDERTIMDLVANTIERMGGDWEIIRSWDKQEAPF